jgi:acyl transferase domain-containing protein/acyl carrier protein
MLRELAATFSPMREMLEQADQILGATPTFEKKGPLTRLIYPPDRFTDAEKASDQKALTATDVAQPALGAASMGIWRLLQKLGVRAEMLGGHSYGEFTALHAAGVLSLEDLLLLSEARGRFITQSAADGDLGTMAAALASEDVIHPLMDGIKDIVLANYNAPGQIILSGPREAIAEAIRRLESAGITAKAIPVAAAFHSELMQPAQKPLAERMAKCEWSEARVAVYSNTTGARHGTTAATRDLMARHLIEPVRFSQMIDAMYAEGARIFLEVGPRSVLADLVRANLQARPGASIAVDSAGRGVTGLLAALGALFAHGVEMDLTVLTRDRIIDEFDAAAMPKPAKQSPTVWMINGGQTKPPASYTPPKAVNGETSVPVGTKTASILDRTAPAAMKPASTSTTPIAGNSARPHVAQPAKQLSSVTHKVHESEGEVTVSSDGSESYGYSDQQSAVLIEYFALMRQFMQVQENVVMSYLGAAPQPPAFGTANLFQSGTQIATGIIGGHRLGPGPGAPAPNRTVQAPLSNGYKPNGSGSNGHSPNGQLSNGQETSARAVSNQAIQPATSVSSNNSNAANSVIASTPSASPTSSANGHSNGAETRQGVAPKNGNAAPIEVESMLVALIADRTGYPPEMLSLDADIEADLGIDSIKRVEILGALRKELPSGLRDALEPHLPALVKAKTLSVIVSIVKQCAGGPAGEATTPFSQGNSPNKNTAPSYPAS